MNVTHPNFGQNYRLTRAALRLGTFTVAELSDLVGAPANSVYSFLSKLRQVNEGAFTFVELDSLRGRPQKRYSLTEAGSNYLGQLSFEMASRFGEEEGVSSHRDGMVGESVVPPSDIYEQDEELVFQVEVPGMSEEDVHVRIEQNDLIVSGERPAALTSRGARPFRIERQHGLFRRAYPLPKACVPKIRNIAVRNGLLEVTLEKAESAHTTLNEGSGSRFRSEASQALPHLEETAGS
jgi:HSP20 family molecular chaperone IbpA